MNETRLCTIEQLEQFLSGCNQIEFTKSGDDGERYEHICRVLNRFDYPRQGKRERGVLLRYLQAISRTALECLLQLSKPGFVTLK